MPYNFETLSSLVQDLYSAAADPSGWDRFLDSIKTEIGGTACAILVRDQRSGHSGQMALSTGIEERFLRAYGEYYSSINVVYEAALAMAPNNYVGTLQHCIDVDVYRNSEIYNDYARPQNLFHQCAALVAREGSYAAALSIMRPESEGAYGEEQIRLLTALAPHMRQAFQLHNTLRSYENSAAGLATALDQSETAIFLLDGQRRLQRANAAGDKLIRDEDVLRLNGNFLEPLQTQISADFERFLSSACSTGAGKGLAPGGMMLLHRPSGSPLHCKISPFYSESTFHEVSPAAILFIGDRDRIPASRNAALQDLYGLTATEARLANLLLEGLDVREAADQMGATFETARFHLKRVLAKTGTHRQTELIRLMLALPGEEGGALPVSRK
jgi:DNA-binding CsgD family transcriptional regulator